MSNRFLPLSCEKRKASSRIGLVVCLLTARSAGAGSYAVTLNSSTSPPSVIADPGSVTLSGSGFPTNDGSLPPASAAVSFALSCGGGVVASTQPSIIFNAGGSTYGVDVPLPGSLSAATYYVSVSGTTSDGTTYVSSNLFGGFCHG